MNATTSAPSPWLTQCSLPDLTPDSSVWKRPPKSPRLGVSQVHLWLSMPQASDFLPSTRLLSKDELQRVERLRSSASRIQFTQARTFLRQVIGQYLDMPPHAIVFQYGPFGKPNLASGLGAPQLQFNLSHCEGWNLLALSEQRIGIDVERIHPIQEIETMVETCFSPAEKQAYQRLPSEKKLSGFIHAWTCKEAYLKALGTGFHRPANSFSVCLDPTRPAELLEDLLEPEQPPHFQFFNVEPVPGFTATLAVEATGVEISHWLYSPPREEIQ